MSRYAIISYVESADRFAVLVESKAGVDTIGVSAQGKEWEKWADALPARDRRTIDQLLLTLGGHLSVEGPKTLTPALKDEFAQLAADNEPNPADVMAGNIKRTQRALRVSR